MDQGRLVAALRQQLGAELIETHISYVLLAGDRAYKIKKAVDLGFLDFSTLAARRFFCAEELRLNRRLAPSLYLDLVAIGGSVAAPRIVAAEVDGALEYAVRMARFAQPALFDAMARRGELGPAQIDSLARVMADFHRDAARATDAAAYGRAADIELPVRQNFEQIRALPAATGDSEALTALERWSFERHAALAPSFERRRAAGFVRECHGDLHLGNVAWIDGAAMPFDGIEFSAPLRWIDSVSEIAFLLMDLHWHQLPHLAWRFLCAYLERSGDYAGLELLDDYLVYRAMVRAKIAAIRASQDGLGAAVRAAALADYAGHLALARQFCQPRRPVLLLMHGYSGSGKSAVARSLVEAGGMLRLRSDVERKRLAGLDALARSASPVNGGLYQQDMTELTYAELTRLARSILVAGWPLVVDATSLRRWQRDLLRELAAELRLPFLIVACAADVELLRQRVSRRAARGRDASEAGLEVLEQQLRGAAADALADDEPVIRVDTGCADEAARSARILTAIRSAACAPG